MTTELTAAAVERIAALAGQPLEEGVAARVAATMGPALATFQVVEASLPFEAEPSGFVLAQQGEGIGR